jgi:hypothetical protein
MEKMAPEVDYSKVVGMLTNTAAHGAAGRRRAAAVSLLRGLLHALDGGGDAKGAPADRHTGHTGVLAVSGEPIFYQRRKLRVKSANETRDVYFVFEKLSADNLDFWTAFNESQIEMSGARGAVSRKNGELVTICDGTKALKESLCIYSEYAEFDTWIAYVCRSVPRAKADVRAYRARVSALARCDTVSEGDAAVAYAQIEMVMSVFGSTTSPITTHMGIFRTHRYWDARNKPCADLSIELHSFAACMSRAMYPRALYMVTKPANTVMREILAKKMPCGTFVVGSPSERAKIKLHSFYMPQSVTGPSLLDDREKRWSVALDLTDHTKRLEFARPDWFIHEYLVTAKQPTGVYELAALARVWATAVPKECW